MIIIKKVLTRQKQSFIYCILLIQKGGRFEKKINVEKKLPLF